MAYFIGDGCVNCGACAGVCPVSCISPGKDRHVIDASKCVSCGACAGVCPFNVPKPEPVGSEE